MAMSRHEWSCVVMNCHEGLLPTWLPCLVAKGKLVRIEKFNFTGLYLKPNELEMGSSLEWADSLNVDFLLEQNALKSLI